MARLQRIRTVLFPPIEESLSHLDPIPTTNEEDSIPEMTREEITQSEEGTVDLYAYDDIDDSSSSADDGDLPDELARRMTVYAPVHSADEDLLSHSPSLLEQNEVEAAADGETTNTLDIGSGGTSATVSGDQKVVAIKMSQEPPPEQPNESPLYRKMFKLIECPVCLDIFRPGTTAVGTCRFGHILCMDCTNTMTGQHIYSCPVCRSETLEGVSHHYFAISVIDALTEMTFYNCRYPACKEWIMGGVLLAHERDCTDRPLVCPREHCKLATPYRQFVDGSHACFLHKEAKLVKGIEGERSANIWEFMLDLEDVFCFDMCREMIFKHFRPVILLPAGAIASANEEIAKDGGVSSAISTKEIKKIEDRHHASHYKLCFNVTANKGLLFHLRILDNVSGQSVKNKTFIISCNIYTYAGKMGYNAKVSPIDSDTDINTHDQALYLTHGDMLRFACLTSPGRPDGNHQRPHRDLTQQMEQLCTSCSSNVSPHMHIEIKEYIE